MRADFFSSFFRASFPGERRLGKSGRSCRDRQAELSRYRPRRVLTLVVRNAPAPDLLDASKPGPCRRTTWRFERCGIARRTRAASRTGLRPVLMVTVIYQMVSTLRLLSNFLFSISAASAHRRHCRSSPSSTITGRFHRSLDHPEITLAQRRVSSDRPQRRR